MNDTRVFPSVILSAGCHWPLAGQCENRGDTGRQAARATRPSVILRGCESNRIFCLFGFALSGRVLGGSLPERDRLEGARVVRTKRCPGRRIA
jgi:hypothetical protein